MNKSWILAMSLATVALVGPAAPAAAQPCGKISWACSGHEWTHTFSQNIWDEENKPWPEDFHGECDLCLYVEGGDTTVAYPWNCHNLCNWSEEESEALAAVFEAIEHDDLRSAIEAGATAPQFVRVSETRRALQVFNCAGQIQAVRPPGDHYEEATLVLSKVSDLATWQGPLLPGTAVPSEPLPGG